MGGSTQHHNTPHSKETTMESLDLGGGSVGSFSFDQVGDSVTGTIVDLTEVQQTDMATGDPAFWPGGQPKMMVRVTLQTGLREGVDDEGKRSVYLRGSRKPDSKSSMAAVLAAVRAAGAGSALAVGGTLTLTFSGEGEATQRGWNRPKHYTATYVPPAPASVNLDAMQVATPPAPVAPAASGVPEQTPEMKAAFAAFLASQQAS